MPFSLLRMFSLGVTKSYISRFSILQQGWRKSFCHHLVVYSVKKSWRIDVKSKRQDLNFSRSVPLSFQIIDVCSRHPNHRCLFAHGLSTSQSISDNQIGPFTKNLNCILLAIWIFSHFFLVNFSTNRYNPSLQSLKTSMLWQYVEI